LIFFKHWAHGTKFVLLGQTAGVVGDALYHSGVHDTGGFLCVTHVARPHLEGNALAENATGCKP
jgi:hypothetical protein